MREIPKYDVSDTSLGNLCNTELLKASEHSETLDFRSLIESNRIGSN